MLITTIFSFSPQCFQKASSSWMLKVRIVWPRENPYTPNLFETMESFSWGYRARSAYTYMQSDLALQLNWFIIDFCNWNHIQCHLTHCQMTNFKLFQIERVCRWQFQIWLIWLKVFQKGRKHCGKRRNCSLLAISPFPTVFSKDLYCKHVKTRACLVKG